MPRLTDNYARHAAPGVHRDTELPGFRLTVSPHGTRVHGLYRRIKGRHLRKSPWRWPDISTETAREMAHREVLVASMGGFPFLSDVTIGELYMLRGQYRPWGEVSASAWRTHLVPLANRRASSLTSDEIRGIHQGLRDTPTMANRALSVLSALYRWGINDGLLGADPTGNVDPYPQPPRRRYLPMDKLSSLWSALNDVPCDVGAVLKLTLVSGLRLSEAMGLDPGTNRLANTVRVHKTSKQTGDKTIYLSSLAQEILEPFRDQDTLCKLSARTVRNYWKKVREAIGEYDLTIHDLRRTMATWASQWGVSDSNIAALLGDTADVAVRTYIAARGEVQDVAEELGQKLRAALEGEGIES